jgi:MerR family transcriptional regulator, light-induced transcriptional regulator
MAGLKHDDFDPTPSSPVFHPRHEHARHEHPRREHPRHESREPRPEWIGETSRAADRAVRLTRTIETEIIPRLLLANSVAQQRAHKAPHAVRIGPDDVTLLADVVVRDDLGDATALIEDHLAKGASLDSIFLDLLAPAARRLGDYWAEDICNFADVTIGLTKLQQLLRIYGSDFEREASPWDGGRRALLAPAHNNKHTFGLLVLEAFFRRAGWDVSSGAGMSMAELAALVRRERFDVVCLSMSCDALLDELGSDISSLRRASRNKAVGIMVGGPAFVGHPDRVTLVGADATATDARQAVHHAERFLGVSARR